MLEPVPFTVNVALSNPLALGVNVMLTAQLAPPASIVPQLLVWVNCLAFVPLNPIVATFTWFLETLVTVTFAGALVCPTGTLPKYTLAGERRK